MDFFKHTEDFKIVKRILMFLLNFSEPAILVTSMNSTGSHLSTSCGCTHLEIRTIPNAQDVTDSRTNRHYPSRTCQESDDSKHERCPGKGCESESLRSSIGEMRHRGEQENRLCGYK